MKKHLIYYLLSFFFIACGSKVSKTHNLEDAKWTAVMANHDVVMPMMGTTNKVRKELKQLLDNEVNLALETTNKINQLITDLDKADEGMMDWMNGFQQLKKLQASKDHKAIMQYLDEQDGIIKQVGVGMTNSIKAGTDFIKEFEQRQQ